MAQEPNPKADKKAKAAAEKKAQAAEKKAKAAEKKEKPVVEKKEKPVAEKKEKKEPKAENPFGEKAAEKADAEKSDAKKADAKNAVPDEPAVAAILETKPATPDECVSAAKTLADLGRLDLAKDFLKKVLEAKLEPQQQADLGEKFGTVTFLDMAERPELLPEAKQLADAVVAASKARREDAQRIEGLIRQLQDPSPEKQVQAIVGLQEAQGAAIGPLIWVLADPARAAEHANVRAALAEMGRIARDPLMAIVEKADPKLAAQAVLILGQMKDSKVALCLLGPALSEKGDAELRAAAKEAIQRLTDRVPDRAEAVRLLTDAAKSYFDRRQAVEGVVDGKVKLWRWDDSKRLCVARIGTPEDAARALAARLARDASSIAPDDREVRLLYLAATLEAAAYQKGLDHPLDEKDPAVAEVKPLGAKTLEEVLDYAMSHGHPAAAAASARLLGQIGKADELLYRSAQPAPLVQALQNSDRRLRMAAAEAIVRLKPTKPFAGASYVPRALGFLAASSGYRRAIVASPNIEEARDLAGRLSTSGFHTDAFLTGKDLLLQAARSPDVELIMVDVTISRPEIGAFLQDLRHDERTASLRVGLTARSGKFEQSEHLERLDPMTKAFSRPHDDKSFRWQLEQLAGLAPQEFVGFEERQRQAAESLDLLAELSQTSSKLYDLSLVQESVLAALYNPKLGVKAAAVLANLNSAESQRSLVEAASRFTLPMALRQAAAIAFRQNTQKFGILLTTEEIRQQYRRYNESEKMDRDTQKLLGRILDCLEVSAPKK